MSIKGIGSWLLRVCSRVTNRGNFVPEVDGLRFIAILLVILTHVATFMKKYTAKDPASLPNDPVWRVLDLGYVGVELFFAISGFIIAVPFARNYIRQQPSPSLRAYYLRRVTRLEPPYIINLLLFFLILVIFRHIPISDLVPHLFASVFYVHNFVYHEPSRINGVAWSLEVEVQFYLIAPLLALVFTLQSRALRRGAIVGAMLAFALLWELFDGTMGRQTVAAYTLFGAVNYFLVGFLLADIYLVDWGGEPPRRTLSWDAVALGSFSAFLAFVLRYDLDRLVCPALIAVFFMSAFRGHLLSSFLRQPLIYVIGGMCYTIYLYHYWILSVVGWVALRLIPMPDAVLPQALILLIVMIPPLLLICGVLFVFLEKPFMNSAWPAQVWGYLRNKREPELRRA
jgi:peptidoglycan/LPS O-acetylase OafA/YrhL